MIILLNISDIFRTSMSGLPGGSNPTAVLYELAHERGIKAPEYVHLSEGPPDAKIFTCQCSFLEVRFVPCTVKKGGGSSPSSLTIKTNCMLNPNNLYIVLF